MIRLALIIVALSGAVPASAQSQADQRFAATKLHHFARCAADSRGTQLLELLRSDYRTKDYDKRMRREIDRSDACLGFGRLRFSMMLFAGAIAEILVERAPGGVAAALRTPIDPSFPPLVAHSEADVMALCTARAAPGASALLLASQPMSAEEVEAVGALLPSLRTCLVSGVNAKLNPAAVRALIALAAWRTADHRAQNGAPILAANK